MRKSFKFIRDEYPENDVILDLTIIILDYLEENYDNFDFYPNTSKEEFIYIVNMDL